MDAVARTVLGFGGEAVVAVDAPSGRRLDLLAPGMPLRDAPRAARPGATSARGCATRSSSAAGCRCTRCRRPARQLEAWEEWIGVGYELFAALDGLGALPARRSPRRSRRRSGDGALRFGRLCETYPDAVFCSLLGHRPSAKRTPWGLQQRIAALRLRGVADDDGGLWHRTLDELDACAAAYAAYALATGAGCWVGDPREGVVVLPVERLAERYDKLPPPARHTLA